MLTDLQPWSPFVFTPPAVPALPLKVAVLTGARAPGVAALLHHARGGRLYRVVCAVSSDDEPCEAAAALAAASVPLLGRPVRAWHRHAGAPLSDLAVRAEYDRWLVETLEPFEPDAIFLAGWLYRLTAPALQRWPSWIFNVHHSDLAAPEPGRRYPGLRAVRDAILAGEQEIRATLHVVDATIDGGAPLLRSWPFPIATLATLAARAGDVGLLRPLVHAHQDRLLGEAFGPLLVAAARMLSQQRIAVERSGAVWIDGVPAPLDLTQDGRLTLPGGSGARPIASAPREVFA